MSSPANGTHLARAFVCPPGSARPAAVPLRRQLQFRLRFALGLGLVSGRVFMRLELARLDLVIMVQHRARGGAVLLGNDIDHEAALNPDEFVRFVSMVRELESAMGCSTPKPFSPEEVKYRKYSKKSLVASRALAKGTIITAEDLRFMRAESLGLPPDQAGRLIGRTTRRTIPAFHLITEDDVS